MKAAFARDKEIGVMAKHNTRRQRDWSEGHERFVRLVQHLSTSCDTCSANLARTHDYVFYGSLCPGCWSQQEPLGGLMASHEPGTGGV